MWVEKQQEVLSEFDGQDVVILGNNHNIQNNGHLKHLCKCPKMEQFGSSLKEVNGMADSAGPYQTLPRRICTDCSDKSVPVLRMFTIYGAQNVKRACVDKVACLSQNLYFFCHILVDEQTSNLYYSFFNCISVIQSLWKIDNKGCVQWMLVGWLFWV